MRYAFLPPEALELENDSSGVQDESTYTELDHFQEKGLGMAFRCLRCLNLVIARRIKMGPLVDGVAPNQEVVADNVKVSNHERGVLRILFQVAVYAPLDGQMHGTSLAIVVCCIVFLSARSWGGTFSILPVHRPKFRLQVAIGFPAL